MCDAACCGGGVVARRCWLRKARKGKGPGSQRADDAGGARGDLAERVRRSGGVSLGAGDGGAEDYFHREEISSAAGRAREERPVAGGTGKRGPFGVGGGEQGRLRASGSKLRADGGLGLAAADSEGGVGCRVCQSCIRRAAEDL